MSYCRFSEGDVYLFMSSQGYCCCSCRLNKREDGEFFYPDTYMNTPQDALDHMLAHKEAGHDFPEDVINTLRAEATNANP